VEDGISIAAKPITDEDVAERWGAGAAFSMRIDAPSITLMSQTLSATLYLP
jgi:hypothetical protein